MRTHPIWWKPIFLIGWTGVAWTLPFIVSYPILVSPRQFDWGPASYQLPLVIAQLPAIWLASVCWMVRERPIWHKIRLLPLSGRWLCGAFCLLIPSAWFVISYPVFVIARCR